MIDNFLEDSRYAVRNLGRDPFLALAATLTLAVCIGANTTVFSVANSILIRPLPYPNSDRIDWISERSGPAQQDVGAAPDYFALREQSRIFEDVAAFNPITTNWTGVERPEQLDAAMISPSFFGVMGTQPMLGRYLAPEEEGPKAPPVAVLSYAFWRNRLGSDPHILGKTIALERLPRTIIGVMPQGFDFPRGSQMWLPLMIDKTTQSFPLSAHRADCDCLYPRPAQAGCDGDPNRDGNESANVRHPRSISRGISKTRLSERLGDRRHAAAGAPHGTSPPRAGDAPRRRWPGSSDRLREHRQFAAGARGQPSTGTGGAPGTRIGPGADHSTNAHGKPGAGSAWRLGRHRYWLGWPYMFWMPSSPRFWFVIRRFRWTGACSLLRLR